MTDSAASNPPLVGPTKEQLARVRELYGEGQYLQAYQLVEPYGPIQNWTQIDAQVLGGRLAHNLGSGRVCRIRHRADGKFLELIDQLA